ncbi:MAG: DUF2141 domain-containing protein [Bacteroidota bacterium]
MFFACLVMWLDTPTNTSSLTVNVYDIDQVGKEKIHVLLWDKSDGFPRDMEKAKYKGTINSFDTNARYTFDNIPIGAYAITLFQDENSNETLDLNFIGIPREPMGAYQQNGLGRPTFKKSTVVLDSPVQSVRIKMIND